MKILIAHNRYVLPGGEDVVFEQETAMLRHFGHEVIVYERSNERRGRSFLPVVVDAAQAVWSRETYTAFSDFLARVRPDLVHVHNTFFRISPSIFDACADAGIPVVHTLHNYRHICPAVTLYRDGAPCEECSTHNPWHGIAHGCYRSSRIATALAASVNAYGWHRGTWTGAITTYIAPSQFLASKLTAAGLPADRVVVKPHFVDPDPACDNNARDDYAIFVGRLSPEKGLQTIMAAWEQLPDIPLQILGDGPERSRLEAVARDKRLNISFRGHVPRDQALTRLKRARLLVFPSISYESFGMGIIEAYACGVPVVASNHGAMRELVEDGRTGLLFEVANPLDLANKVRRLYSDRDLLADTSNNARRAYERKYTMATNYRRLIQIYEAAISDNVEREAIPAAA